MRVWGVFFIVPDSSFLPVPPRCITQEDGGRASPSFSLPHYQHKGQSLNADLVEDHFFVVNMVIARLVSITNKGEIRLSTRNAKWTHCSLARSFSRCWLKAWSHRSKLKLWIRPRKISRLSIFSKTTSRHIILLELRLSLPVLSSVVTNLLFDCSTSIH
jgi:hypothetical protein